MKKWQPRLKITARNSTVLGYPADGSGRELWAELDWSAAWVDEFESQMYLHVRVKHKPAEDGPNKTDRRWYRVRCRYDEKYRGKPVESIGLGVFDGEWTWIVRCR